MVIHNIRKIKGTKQLLIEGFWGDYSASLRTLDGKEFREMIEALEGSEMKDVSEQYKLELLAVHQNKADYDEQTGKVKEDTPAAYARKILIDHLGHKEKDLYNPLHDEISTTKKLQKSGEFRTTEAAEVLSRIPGVVNEGQEGHDIRIKYKGRTKRLMGGSGRTGNTNANAVDQILDMIVRQDIAKGHVHEENKDKRLKALKGSIYKT